MVRDKLQFQELKILLSEFLCEFIKIAYAYASFLYYNYTSMHQDSW